MSSRLKCACNDCLTAISSFAEPLRHVLESGRQSRYQWVGQVQLPVETEGRLVVPVETRSVSLCAIESSKEVQSWLSQFAPDLRAVAKSLLMRLRFVSRDAYSSWLLDKLQSLTADGKCAAYSVRRPRGGQRCLWDSSGHIAARCGASRGSEDFVYSLINIAVKRTDGAILDHADLVLRLLSYML